jgi:hypothetical protein
MYFGIGYAVNHVAADDDLAGLIITGGTERRAADRDVL